MKITITQPDDWHLHVREGDMLTTVVADSARVFARAMIMPNLTHPIQTVEQALTYRQQILQALPKGNAFNPLMTLYLTHQTSAREIEAAAHAEHVHAIKLYPAGATTNASQGIHTLETIYPLLGLMEKHQLPLLIHGEVTTPDVDIFDREAVFIEQHLQPIVQRFPQLRIVLEHITTQNAVDFVLSQPPHVSATITAHHLLLNRNAMLVDGIHPHYYCLPILKRTRHQRALIQAATSANPKFFLGTDSAPHTQKAKESACGCAGSYTALAAMPLYASVFAAANALDKLEGFSSHFGPDFYALPRNTTTITLTESTWTVPQELSIGEDQLIPFYAGKTLHWNVAPRT